MRGGRGEHVWREEVCSIRVLHEGSDRVAVRLSLGVRQEDDPLEILLDGAEREVIPELSADGSVPGCSVLSKLADPEEL
eukprot:7403132-Heterocapsa_arctica.AAC.1